jgi:hypothetical protein
VGRRAAHAIVLATALAAVSLFYLGAPTVYAYFSEVRLSYSFVPDWSIRTPPARVTSRLFAAYNDASPLTARVRTRGSCRLIDDGARQISECVHEGRAGSRIYGPAALKLIAGGYVARFEFSRSETCAGAGDARLDVAATGRFGKPLAVYAGPIHAGDRIDVPFTMKSIDAAFTDVQFAVSPTSGCVVLRALVLEDLSIGAY